jgi:hypothetical protein
VGLQRFCDCVCDPVGYINVGCRHQGSGRVNRRRVYDGIEIITELIFRITEDGFSASLRPAGRS